MIASVGFEMKLWWLRELPNGREENAGHHNGTEQVKENVIIIIKRADCIDQSECELVVNQ